MYDLALSEGRPSKMAWVIVLELTSSVSIPTFVPRSYIYMPLSEWPWLVFKLYPTVRPLSHASPYNQLHHTIMHYWQWYTLSGRQWMIWNGSSIQYGIFFDGKSISGLRLGWNWIEKIKIILISNDTEGTVQNGTSQVYVYMLVNIVRIFWNKWVHCARASHI